MVIDTIKINSYIINNKIIWLDAFDEVHEWL